MWPLIRFIRTFVRFVARKDLKAIIIRCKETARSDQRTRCGAAASQICHTCKPCLQSGEPRPLAVSSAIYWEATEGLRINRTGSAEIRDALGPDITSPRAPAACVANQSTARRDERKRTLQTTRAETDTRSVDLGPVDRSS
ncbi:protein of unknown function [Hyphomicrobium sp. 1Nfss2.1]